MDLQAVDPRGAERDLRHSDHVQHPIRERAPVRLLEDELDRAGPDGLDVHLGRLARWHGADDRRTIARLPRRSRQEAPQDHAVVRADAEAEHLGASGRELGPRREEKALVVAFEAAQALAPVRWLEEKWMDAAPFGHAMARA